MNYSFNHLNTNTQKDYSFSQSRFNTPNYDVSLNLDYKNLMKISGGDGGMVDYSVM
jgi:hypothetical protein